MKKIIVMGAIIAAAGLTVAGCGVGKVSEPYNDAQRTGVTNNAPVDVITNADGFSNLSTKCDHGNRIYIAFHGDSPYAAMAVVAKDPSCHGNVSVDSNG